MKIDDLYGLDDNIEHFVIHSAEEELSSVKILNVEIKKSKQKIVFFFYCDRNDGEFKKGRQEDLSDKLQKRISKFHKNFIRNVEVHVIQK
jgi:hypothetical protein